MFSVPSLTMSKNVKGTVIHPPTKIKSLDEISLFFISIVPKLSLQPVKRELSELSLKKTCSSAQMKSCFSCTTCIHLNV